MFIAFGASAKRLLKVSFSYLKDAAYPEQHISAKLIRIYENVRNGRPIRASIFRASYFYVAESQMTFFDRTRMMDGVRLEQLVSFYSHTAAASYSKTTSSLSLFRLKRNYIFEADR